MDWSYFLDFLSEATYLLVVFGGFFFYTVVRGRQAIINVIISLYFALLVSLQFPYNDALFGTLGAQQSSLAQLIFFGFVSLLMLWLCHRIMPDEFREHRFESLGKKFLHATSATILVMIFSFHVLPVTEFLTPGTPVQSLFAHEQFFFAWLVAPFIVLFFV